MFNNAEHLQEKWKPLLEHDGIDAIKDNHRKAVTAVLLENQERFLSEEKSRSLNKSPFVVWKNQDFFNKQPRKSNATPKAEAPIRCSCCRACSTFS